MGVLITPCVPFVDSIAVLGTHLLTKLIYVPLAFDYTSKIECLGRCCRSSLNSCVSKSLLSILSSIGISPRLSLAYGYPGLNTARQCTRQFFFSGSKRRRREFLPEPKITPNLRNARSKCSSELYFRRFRSSSRSDLAPTELLFDRGLLMTSWSNHLRILPPHLPLII